MQNNIWSTLICILLLISLITASEIIKGKDLAATEQTQEKISSFILKSSEVKDGGDLPVEFTGDGSGATLPLEWKNAPEETKSFVIIMHHIDREGKAKWYLTLYNIPADVRSLPKNVNGKGTMGNNSINGRNEYAPPHSKGPGAKTYIYTIYALSELLELKVTPDQVSRDVLLKAMENHILATAEMKVIYTRQGEEEHQEGSDDKQPPPEQQDKEKPTK